MDTYNNAREIERTFLSVTYQAASCSFDFVGLTRDLIVFGPERLSLNSILLKVWVLLSVRVTKLGLSL